MKLFRINIRNLLKYLFVLLLDVAGIWYFHGYLFLMILVLLMLALPGSILTHRVATKRLSVTYEKHVSFLNRGERFHTALKLKNNIILPIVNMYVDFTEENAFLDGVREFKKISLKRKTLLLKKPIQKVSVNTFRRRYCFLAPKAAQTINFTGNTANCGLLIFKPETIIVTEYFGIVSFRFTKVPSTSVTVLPTVDNRYLSKFQSFFSNYENMDQTSSIGEMSPEISEIKAYTPGDRMNSVHWKLSSRFDTLMVKKLETLSGKNLIVGVELYEKELEHHTYDRHTKLQINDLLDLTCSTIKYLLDNSYTVRLVWWSVKEDGIRHFDIFHEDALVDGCNRLMSEQTYTERSLLEEKLSNTKNTLIINNNGEYRFGQS